MDSNERIDRLNVYMAPLQFTDYIQQTFAWMLDDFKTGFVSCSLDEQLWGIQTPDVWIGCHCQCK